MKKLFAVTVLVGSALLAYFIAVAVLVGGVIDLHQGNPWREPWAISQIFLAFIALAGISYVGWLIGLLIGPDRNCRDGGFRRRLYL